MRRREQLALATRHRPAVNPGQPVDLQSKVDSYTTALYAVKDAATIATAKSIATAALTETTTSERSTAAHG